MKSLAPSLGPRLNSAENLKGGNDTKMDLSARYESSVYRYIACSR